MKYKYFVIRKSRDQNDKFYNQIAKQIRVCGSEAEYRAPNSNVWLKDKKRLYYSATQGFGSLADDCEPFLPDKIESCEKKNTKTLVPA